MSPKSLVHNQHGPEDVEKAILAMTLAETARARGAETVVFMTCCGVELAVRGFESRRRIAGYPGLDELLGSFIARGGRVWVHDGSAAARGISAESLIDAAEFVDAARATAFIADGGRVLA